MKYNIEEMIDRYFDGQLSATEQTDLLSQVSGDPAAQQLFEAEQFIRGAFTHDVSAIPQAAMEPSATLLAKLSATKPLASQAVTQSTQEVARETVTHTVASQASTVATQGTTALTGKVAVGTLATAGKTILGLSVGAFKAIVGTVATVAVATAVIVSTNNSSPDVEQIAAPVADSSANSFFIEHKVDTPITVSSTPVEQLDAKQSRIQTDVKPVVSEQPIYDPMKELEGQKPQVRTTDTTKTKFDTRVGN